MSASSQPPNQRFEVVIRSESKLASWESALGTRQAGRQKDLKGSEGGTKEGRELSSSGGKRGKKVVAWSVGRSVDSRPQSGSVYKVKEETNGAAVVTLLKWGLA